VLDYDDVALYGHPSAVLVPAILAEGEAIGASGREAVCAYVAGYETWSDLIGRDRDLHHDKGWHPTGVFGTVAAAAAAAKLRRLNAERASHAVGLAASMAAGLTANFGSMAKSWVAGRAAQNGVLAARLAAAGMTAAPDALERAPGFLHAFSPHGDVDLERGTTFGREWTILRHGLSVKRYPMCFYGQRGLDAMFALLAEHPLRPDEVRRVRVLLGPTEAGILRACHGHGAGGRLGK
jgi:2-methylcitrate dehydratase PrpD